MASKESMENGASHRPIGRDFARELQDTVLPQAAALLSDAETVLRQEIKLLEARLLFRAAKLETRMIISLLGVGALLVGFGFFLATLFYVIRDNFPNLPLWNVTGIFALTICAVGGFLLSGGANSEESDAEGA